MFGSWIASKHDGHAGQGRFAFPLGCAKNNRTKTTSLYDPFGKDRMALFGRDYCAVRDSKVANTGDCRDMEPVPKGCPGGADTALERTGMALSVSVRAPERGQSVVSSAHSYR